MRPTYLSRDVRAGCFVCHGTDAHWIGPNAQGVAARHYDATKHATWCDVYMGIRYGEQAADPRQTDIEDAIASSSGGEPEAAPLTDPAPAKPLASRTNLTADPIGTPRSMQRGGRGRKPEIHAP
ncbi:hypothetical protein [Sphingomonas sp. VNH70]|uniref:hypothetical protein n=1 Tax=Sphingomonas silueang TaxID=3156617 RepID=UPI0032B52BAB